VILRAAWWFLVEKWGKKEEKKEKRGIGVLLPA
jgi:hypothetical protein